jgi:Secretion system C-terminal sorting domain
MKRTMVAVLAVLLTASISLAQWDIDESFDGGIPDGWTVTNTWNLAQSGTFPTPYIWASATGHGDPRLISAPIDISGAETVVIQMYYFIRSGGGDADFRYRVGATGRWQWVEGWTIPGSLYGICNIILDQDELTDDVLYLYWSAGISPDGGIHEFAIDNVRVSTRFPGWVDFDAIYHNGPGLPNGGGNVSYDLSIGNTLPLPLNSLRVGTMIQINEQIYGPFNPQLVNVPANNTLVLPNQSIYIPGFLNGYWIYVTPVVSLPGIPSFQFMDWAYFYIMGEPDSNDENAMTNWQNQWLYELTEWESGEVSTTPQPDPHFTVRSYPNPFNPTTTITVTLSDVAELTLTVHNTLGQQVTVLANGTVNAGTHTFTFDGSNLSSGIYFVQASVPNELNAVQKIVLMK